MSLLKDSLHDVLQCCQPIALGQMDGVALLNRVDRKYVLPIAHLKPLLVHLSASYYILEIGGHRTFSYNTVYFDTKDFKLYQDHHNGLSNRIKVRCRQYEETAVTFFEIKRKYAGTRTDKYRRAVPAVMDELDELAYEAILTRYPKHPLTALKPTLNNRFSRITLVSKTMTERCTIDFDVSFRSPGGVEAFIEDFAIVELKQGKTDVQSPVVKALKAMRIYPASISKYAYGLMLTQPALKHNAFKALLHRIEKLTGSARRIATPTTHPVIAA